MNTIILISFMTALTGTMLLILDHHYYHLATVALLEKKIQQDYEVEGLKEYEEALKKNII